MNRMKNHVFAAAACLLLAACSGNETKVAKLEVIPVGAAFERQAELKASDCFKKYGMSRWRRRTVAWSARGRMLRS